MSCANYIVRSNTFVETKIMLKKISILVFLSIILFFFSCSKEQQVAIKRQNDDSSRFIKVFQSAKGTNDRLSEKPSLEFAEIPSERFNDIPFAIKHNNEAAETRSLSHSILTFIIEL